MPFTTNLDSYIAKYSAEAKATGSTQTRNHVNRLRMERAMLITIVNGALKGGNTISVHDGEEWAIKKSRDKQAILSALATTDEDTILVRDAAGNRLGRFMLVYGNDGYDLVADYGVNEWTENFYQTVIEPRARRLEEKGV